MLLVVLGKQLKKTPWQGLMGTREDRGASILGIFGATGLQKHGRADSAAERQLAQWLGCWLGRCEFKPFLWADPV